MNSNKPITAIDAILRQFPPPYTYTGDSIRCRNGKPINGCSFQMIEDELRVLSISQCNKAMNEFICSLLNAHFSNEKKIGVSVETKH